ncbi:MAG TPA: inosine/xanthosine triphosphatase [Candidatus Paceibacterota bacterium]
MKTLSILICSESPAKTEATRLAFQEAFPNTNLRYYNFAADSKIHIQPISLEMTALGAINRINGALQNIPGCDYYVSIESGVNKLFDQIVCFSVICIHEAATNKRVVIPGSSIPLPSQIYEEKIFRHMSGVGEITDEYFGVENTKKFDGAFSYLSNGKFKRYEVDARDISFALLPFISEFYK